MHSKADETFMIELVSASLSATQQCVSFQESVQAIIEIKFSNIIVEILVEEQAIIFHDVDEEKKSDADAHENLPSPKVFTKTATRLPSQR